MRRFAAIVMLFWIGCVTPAVADLYKWSGNGTDWCRFAETYLDPVGGRPAFTCDAQGNKLTGQNSLCIRLNNYGCLWQRRASWPGTEMQPGNPGAHDGRGGLNGHSVFVDPIYSLAAKFHWFASRDKASALDHAETYLPWCDTLGSSSKRGEFHRSCNVSEAQRVPGRRYCQKPANGQPSAAQCKACNCPSVLAATWVEGTGFAPTDPLDLIGSDGVPNDLLIRIALRNSVNELGGYRPNEAAIRAAQRLYPRLYPTK